MFVRSAVAFACFVVLLDSSAASPTHDKSEKFSYTVYDHSGHVSFTIRASGRFRNFEIVRDAIIQIENGRANWCGFGFKLLADGIDKSWSYEERREFGQMLQRYECEESKTQGFFESDRSKIATSEDAETRRKQKSSDANVIAFIILGMAVAVIVFILITMIVVLCCAEEPLKTKGSASLDEEERSRRVSMWMGV